MKSQEILVQSAAVAEGRQGLEQRTCSEKEEEEA
jgi:hypothetical protein